MDEVVLWLQENKFLVMLIIITVVAVYTKVFTRDVPPTTNGPDWTEKDSSSDKYIHRKPKL